MFCLFGFFCLFCLIFIGRYTDVRQENASVRSHNRSHGTNYWNESGCWGENDMKSRWKQILFWGEFREQLLDLQMVSWLLFWAAFTGPIVEDWQVGNRADPAPVPRLVLLTPNADTGASAGVGYRLVPPPETTLVYWLPRVRRHHACWLQCQKIKKHKTRATNRTENREGWPVFGLFFCSHPPGFTITWTSSMVRPITS